MFNNETEIVHGDDIYIKPTLFHDKSSYMYCGKPYLDTWTNNDECSSKECINNYCIIQKKMKVLMKVKV